MRLVQKSSSTDIVSVDIVPTMQYHCFDNIDRLLYHPPGEQTSQMACASGHRPDVKIRVVRRQVGLMNMSFNSKGCSYIEQVALVVQNSELDD
jgi:hypothetical protein